MIRRVTGFWLLTQETTHRWCQTLRCGDADSANLGGNAGRARHWRPQIEVLGESLTSEMIDVDTLIIGGSADALRPAAAIDELAAAIARSRPATLEGAGHLMILERPEDFTRLVSAVAT